MSIAGGAEKGLRDEARMSDAADRVLPADRNVPAHRDTGRPLVSVCISAFNVERYLAAALRSVLGQTYPNLEVILFDNGSTDGTYDVARSLADPRLRCLRIPENIGGYQGMNKAISLARGDLLAVYHSDDIYEPDIVEKEVAYLQSHPQVGSVFCLDHFMDEAGRIYGGLDLPRELAGKEWLGYEEIFRFFVRHQNTVVVCPTFMVRREVLDAVGPFNPERYDIGADLEMWLRIARRFPIGILNERLMRYRHFPKQWSNRYKHLRTTRDVFFDVMEEYLEKDGWRPKLSRSDLVEYAFYRCDDNTTRAANLLILGEVPAARELLQDSYPWRTLLESFRRRKLRVLLLRALMQAALAFEAARPLARLLVWTEYGGRV